MKAVIITTYGAAEVLKVEERSVPLVTAGHVLIEVYAAGINRLDIFQRKGNYPAPADTVQDIPGLEVAGKIVAVGEGVDMAYIGQEVMALLSGGGYAEYALAPLSSCIAKPANLSFAEAASLPEALFTVWHNIFQRAQLKRGEHLLVHGGAGGVGSTAIQLAALNGAVVYTTVGSEEKGEFAKKIGATQVINYHLEDFETVLKDTPVHVILDSIGGNYFTKNLNIIAQDGRLVYINAMKGAKVGINLLQLMQKRVYLTGSTLRARDTAFKAQLAMEIQKQVVPLLENGSFKTSVYRVFPYEQAAEAHQLMESGTFMGKIVLDFRAK